MDQGLNHGHGQVQQDITPADYRSTRDEKDHEWLDIEQ